MDGEVTDCIVGHPEEGNTSEMLNMLNYLFYARCMKYEMLPAAMTCCLDY